MGKNDELLIQCDIVKYLQSEKVYFFSVPNEAYGRNKIQHMQLISAGLRAGVSDMILWIGKETLYVEVKKPGGKQSEAQKRFQKRCEDTGRKYFVVFSVEDVKKIVDKYID